MGKRKTKLSDIPKRPKYNVTDSEGNKIQKGDTVTDFRGDTATFRMVSRGPLPGKSAKVVVDDLPGEYYAGVFDLIVTEVPDE